MDGDKVSLALSVNGRDHALEDDPDAILLDVLRNTLGLKGLRFGCGAEQCGACMVLLDGFAVPSCATPLWSVQGKEVITLEGLGTPEHPHPLQTAFLAEQAGQCGYCIAGIIIRAAGLLRRNPNPTEAEIRNELDRNLCRCGAHNRMLRAIANAAALIRQDAS